MLSRTTHTGRVISHKNLFCPTLAKKHRTVSPDLRAKRAAVTWFRSQDPSLVAKGKAMLCTAPLHLIFPHLTSEIGEPRDKRLGNSPPPTPRGGRLEGGKLLGISPAEGGFPGSCTDWGVCREAEFSCHSTKQHQHHFHEGQPVPSLHPPNLLCDVLQPQGLLLTYLMFLHTSRFIFPQQPELNFKPPPGKLTDHTCCRLSLCPTRITPKSSVLKLHLSRSFLWVKS